jgi:hypothetical protein
VSFTDGDDLFEVVLAVDELKSAPLFDVERAEDSVTGALAGRSEESFGLGEKQIEMGKMFGGGLGEVFAGVGLRG